jgi:hypothetical protein
LVEFGLVHPGNYSFRVVKRVDAVDVSTEGQFTVDPGSRVLKTIVCPRIPLDHPAVQIRADWPPDLQKEGLVVDASFYKDGFSLHESVWNTQGWGTVLIGPGSAMTEATGDLTPYLWGPDSGPRWADWPAADLRALTVPGETLHWGRSTYRLYRLCVLRPQQSAPGGALRRFDLLAVAGTSGFARRKDPPIGPELRGFGGDNWEIPSPPRVTFPNQFAPMNHGGGDFEAKPGQVNEWTIPLWDELLATVRQSLKAAGSEPAR